MDFLTTGMRPWRITVDKVSDLLNPDEVLIVASSINVRLTTPYGTENLVLEKHNKGANGKGPITRKRVAMFIRKHLKAAGRSQRQVMSHRDCFLVSLDAHNVEPVWVVNIQCAPDLGLPSWDDLRE